MKHYIYPKGVTGQQLGWLMEYCGEVGGGVEYIDDSIPEISFEAMKEKLKKEDCVVHVALSKISPHYEKSLENISKKLEANGISFLTNSVEEYWRKSANLAKKDLYDGCNKIVCLVLEGYGDSKNAGFLEQELRKKNVSLLCVYTDLNLYQKALVEMDRNLLYFSYEYLYLLDWVDMFCLLGSYEGIPSKSKYIMIGHGIVHYEESRLLLYGVDEVCIAGPRFLPDKDFKDIGIIKCGYLGFDPIFKKLNKIKSQKEFIKDSVFIAPYNMEEVKILSQYIKMILSKYRVIFRYREEFQDAHLPYINEFLKNENFYIDDASGIAPESYLQSFCGIFKITSSKNTFPLLSLSPSIVLPHDYAALGLAVDTRIGINFHRDPTPQELLKTIDDIYNNQEKWKESILDYREKEIYNFGHASEYLADYLVKKYDLVAKNL